MTEPVLHLWLLTGTAEGHDTYDACIVAAFTSEEAKAIHPRRVHAWARDCEWAAEWANSPEDVTAKIIGTVTDPTIKASDVILASFNAG